MANGVRIGLLGAFAFVVLATAGCSREFIVTGPEDPPPPGYAGLWSGSFQGSTLSLNIQPFDNRLRAVGRIQWQTINWPIACRAFPDNQGEGDGDRLQCTIDPQADVDFCGAPDPFIEFTTAVARTRLVADVGGEIRELVGEQCTGAVIASFEPAGTVELIPDLSD